MNAGQIRKMFLRMPGPVHLVTEQIGELHNLTILGQLLGLNKYLLQIYYHCELPRLSHLFRRYDSEGRWSATRYYECNEATRQLGRGPIPLKESVAPRLTGSEIGLRLRTLMTERGLAQEDISATSGISQTYLSRLFSGGRAHPSFAMVVRVAAALGASLNEVAGISGDAATAANVSVDRRVHRLALKVARLESIFLQALQIASESVHEQLEPQIAPPRKTPRKSVKKTAKKKRH